MNTAYCVEYSEKFEDDEKEMTVYKTVEFASILSMVKWARVLPTRCAITKKFKVSTEKFSFLDEREFEIELSRGHRI